MRFGKHMLASAAMVGILSLAATPVLASPTLVYYDIAVDGSSVNFTPTNSSNVVTIYGWQDTNDQAHPADEQYAIYQYGFWSDTRFGSTRITGNYPQSSQNWYKATFTGIQPNYEYYVKWYNWSSAAKHNGAGNAYDGY